jgi:hypothetical protein
MMCVLLPLMLSLMLLLMLLPLLRAMSDPRGAERCSGN